MTVRAGAAVALVVACLGVLSAAVAAAVRSGAGADRAALVLGATGPGGAPVAAPPGPALPPAAALPRLSVRPQAPAPRLQATPPVPGADGAAPGAPGAAAPGATASPNADAAPILRSRALGKPNRGRLRNGVLLPADGPDVVTWDAVLQQSPNRDWRRVGTDRLVQTILTVAAAYRRAHPGAPRLVVSDLSLPQGGRFGPEYGGLGHASHQNGLDVDIAYPRRDRRERGVRGVRQIDRPLAQALVDAFVKAGAQYVFVGPRTGLRGPARVVQPLANHDDHLHVRIPKAGSALVGR